MHTYGTNKVFRNISNATFVSFIGDNIFYMALIAFASGLKNSGLAISLVTTLSTVPQLSGILLGHRADLIKDKVRALKWSNFFRFILFLINACVFMFFKGWHVLIGALLVNFICDSLGVLGDGLNFSVLAGTLSDEEYESGFGFNFGVGQAISMIAQFSGTWLLIVLHYRYSLFSVINAISFVFAIYFLNRVAIKNKLGIEKDDELARSLMDKIKSFMKHKKIMILTVYIASINGLLAPILPLLFMKSLKGGAMILLSYPFTVSLVGSIDSIGTILGSLISSKFERFSIYSLLRVNMMLTIVELVLIYMNSLVVLLPIIFFSSLLVGLTMPMFEAELVTNCDSDSLGMVDGLIDSVLVCVVPVGTGIFTGIATQNVSLALVILMLLLVILIILSGTMLRRWE
ncbi:MFS transporter [Levilactobacillus brevis]|uniref:MFS transporter n=1 Tax=Levilactobacillus brevis TaxID=1580 RepID=UPI00339C8A4F